MRQRVSIIAIMKPSRAVLVYCFFLISSSTVVLAIQSPRPQAGTHLKAAVLESPVINAEALTGPTTWECDEDINCVEVPACDEQVCRTSLDVRIHGNWYDLSGKSSSETFGDRVMENS